MRRCAFRLAGYGGDGGRRAIARLAIALVPAALFLLASPCGAQNAQLEPDLTDAGLAIGGFLIFPRVTVDNYVNDNVFATEEDAVTDYIASITTRLGLRTTWARHYLAASGAGRFNRYARLGSEDNDEYAIDAEGRYDLTGTSSLAGAFGQGRRTVGRTDAENSGRVDPQQLDYYDGELRYRQEFARLDLDLRGLVRRLDWLEARDDDQDRYVFGGEARLVHRFSPAFSLFLEPGVAALDYDQKIDNTGVQRDAISGRVLFGAAFDITSVIAGELAVGPEHTSFDEPTFDDLTTPAVLGSVRWDVTRLSRLELDLRRRVAPTTRRGASSKVQSLVSLELRHALLRSVDLRVEGAYFREKFTGLGRIDDNYRVRVGADYAVNRFFSIAAGYDFRVRDSNAPGRSFERNLVTLSFDTGF